MAALQHDHNQRGSLDNLRMKKLLSPAIVLAVFLLDRFTKSWTLAHLLNRSVAVLPFLKFTYAENTGVAFGMFQQLPGGRIWLTVVALAALLLVGYYLVRSHPRQLRLHLALGLVGGGAVGNLVDRIAFGRVTDFIVWKVGTHEWPAFNIADAALVVGVALMALDMLLDKHGHSAEAAPPPESASSKES